MAELLPELGANPTITDIDHQATPLGWARRGGRSKVAGLLGTDDQLDS